VTARSLLRMLVLGILAAAGGYWAGIGSATRLLGNVPPAAGPIIYYRDPDGAFRYSAGPLSTPDGRAYQPVYASQDVSFDGPAPTRSDPDAERRVLFYRNPMGLPDTSPLPKKDSMGMDYLPVYEDQAPDDQSVRISFGKIQRIGVKTALARRGLATRPIQAPARLQLDERRVHIVATRTEAFVEEVADVTTGDTVAKGQMLVGLFAREIAAAGAEYITNLASGSASNGAVQRLKNLGVSPVVIEEIRQSRKVPERIAVTAPSGGVVLERAAVPGMMASPGAVLFRIADTSRLWALASVPESSLSAVAAGAPVALKVRGVPERSFQARIDLIYPEIDAVTRTATIRIEIDNVGGMLRPNMYADAEIRSSPRAASTTVPASAIVDTGERRVVFVDKGDGRFEPRQVELGLRSPDAVEILKGVAEGERVVVSANFLIDAESNLQSALSSFTAPEARP